jgi:hypothetical protein
VTCGDARARVQSIGEVPPLAAVHRDDPQVAGIDLVGLLEDDSLAVRRPVRIVHLESRVIGHGAFVSAAAFQVATQLPGAMSGLDHRAPDLGGSGIYW